MSPISNWILSDKLDVVDKWKAAVVVFVKVVCIFDALWNKIGDLFGNSFLISIGNVHL